MEPPVILFLGGLPGTAGETVPGRGAGGNFWKRPDGTAERRPPPSSPRTDCPVGDTAWESGDEDPGSLVEVCDVCIRIKRAGLYLCYTLVSMPSRRRGPLALGEIQPPQSRHFIPGTPQFGLVSPSLFSHSIPPSSPARRLNADSSSNREPTSFIFT